MLSSFVHSHSGTLFTRKRSRTAKVRYGLDTAVVRAAAADSRSAKPTTTRRHPISRRVALRQFGALALASVALPVVPSADATASPAAGTTAYDYFLTQKGYGADWNSTSAGREPLCILSKRVVFLGFVAAFTSFGRAMSDRESGRVQLPEVYDSAAVARYFSLRPDRVVQRLGELIYEALSLGLLSVRHRVDAMLNDGALTPGARKLRAESRTKEAASALRESVGRLGPAFVKLAQGFAMRPDIIGIELAQQFQTLQDSVLDPFPVIDALELFKKEMGCSAKAMFDVLDTNPIAGASLGMVFRGVIDDQLVAVKIQRPNVAERIAMDFYIVRTMLRVGIRFFGVRQELRGVLDDFAGQVFQELDYRNEVQNILKFKRAYANVPDIIIPKPYAAYSSKRVLVEEFITGRKLLSDFSTTTNDNNNNNSDASSSNSSSRKKDEEKLAVVEIGIQFALTQLLDQGLLHADMHSGNILWTDKGQIALIDFGIVQEIPRDVREMIVLGLFYLIQGEYKLLAETLLHLAHFGPEMVDEDLPSFANALSEEFGVVQNNNNTDNGANGNINNISLLERRFTLVGVVEKLLHLGGRYPLVFNTYFLNALRCLAMLEGVAMNSDSDFSMFNVLYPTVMRKMLEGEMHGRYKTGLEKVLRAENGSFQWDKLDRMLSKARQAEMTGSNMILLATSGSKYSNTALDELLLSSKGRFLRAELAREWQGDRARGVFKRSGPLGKFKALFLLIPWLVWRFMVYWIRAVIIGVRSGVRKLFRIQVRP